MTRRRFALTLFALAMSAAVGRGEAEESTLALRYRDGRLSLHAHQVTLPAVLQRIAETTCIQFHVPEEAGTSLGNWGFTELPLEEALVELARPNSVALFREVAESPRQLACLALWILPSSAGGSPESTGLPVALDAASEVSRLVGLIRGEADLEVRRQAIGDLASLPPPDATQGLEMALGVSEPELRRAVVQALGSVYSDAPPTALGQVLFGDRDVTVRLMAIQALSEQDGEVARLFLKRALDDKDQRIRDAVTKALWVSDPR